MRQVIKEYNVYSFNELSDKAKEKARDWFKNGQDFDADYILEDSKEIGKLMGISIDKIYYTGFASQGDGACFTGKYSHVKGAVKKVKEYAPKDERLSDIALLLELSSPLTAVIEHKGRYYHSGCMDIFCDTGDDEKHEKEVELLEDALKAFADWVYRSLEKEYYYQTSNEAIDENILANEYEFLENGSIA